MYERSKARLNKPLRSIVLNIPQTYPALALNGILTAGFVCPDLKKVISGIISKRLDIKIYRLFFFGSRVSDKGSYRSDIDIGIEGDNGIPYEVMYEIREDLENLPILYKLEIVDFKKVSPDFKKVALQNIEDIS